MNSKRQFILILTILVVLAFLLRLEVCRELLSVDAQVSCPSAGTDMATYRELAFKVFDGKFTEEFYYQPFYYVVFLPLVIFIAGGGGGIWAVLFAQSFISALTVLFSALTCSMLWGRRAGLICATLLLFAKILSFYTPYHLIATSQAFWISLIAYFSVLACRKKSKTLWAICGMLVSFAILTRGNIWFFVPGILIAATISGRRESLLKAFLMPALFLAMVVIPQVPFSCWNYKITGDFSGPSTATGAVLGLGNTPEAPPGGRNPGAGPGPMEYPETYYDWGAQIEKVSVQKQILKWFFTEPAAFIELQFRKLLLYWDYREIPNNISYEYQGVRSPALRFICFMPTSLLICAMLAFFAGTVIDRFCELRKKNPTLTNKWKYYALHILKTTSTPKNLLFYFVAAYWLGTAVFYNLARFRVPSIPLFAIFAAVYVDRLFTSLKNKDQILRRSLFVGLVIGILVVFASYDFYRFKLESSIMKIVRKNGIRVSLSDGRLLLLDNGPMSFGSWTPIELKENMVLKKKFVAPEKCADKPAKFSITLLFEIPGKGEIEINGTKKTFSTDTQGRAEKTFIIGQVPNGEITIRVISLDCKAYILVDVQRDYGRTILDSRILPAELVSRIYYGE